MDTEEKKTTEQETENNPEVNTDSATESETVQNTKKSKEEKKAEKKQKKDKTSSREQELSKQLDEQKELYLRLRAEYDNFRKRSQKEKEEVHTTARADVIKSIVPVLDNFERAAGNAEASFEDYRKGVELINTQLKDVLKKIGVLEFGEVGDSFDPNIHNAVMHIESDDFGENVIAQVFQRGYKLGETVIRFAVVQVAN